MDIKRLLYNFYCMYLFSIFIQYFQIYLLVLVRKLNLSYKSFEVADYKSEVKVLKIKIADLISKKLLLFEKVSLL